MKISYFIVNVILFSCAHHKHTTVKGFVILNTNATQVGTEDSPSEISQSSSDAGPVAVAPEILVQPLTVIADAPATDNANQSDSSVAEPVAAVPQVFKHPVMLVASAPVADNVNTSDSSVAVPSTEPVSDNNGSLAQPVVSPVRRVFKHPVMLVASAPVADNVNTSDSSVAVPSTEPVSDNNGSLAQPVVSPVRRVFKHPVMLVASAPVADNVNSPDSSVAVPSTEPVSDNNDSLAQPVLSPVITSIDTVDSQSNNVETVSNDNLKTHNSSNPCSGIFNCPLICQNSLPAIPSEGICCPRCVTNPNCNVSTCPKFKCKTHLVPANLTAGECCDHCAPVTKPAVHKSTKVTKASRTKSTKPKKTTVAPKKTRSPSRSSKQEFSNHSHLIRLLIEALDLLRDSPSDWQHYDSNESQED